MGFATGPRRPRPPRRNERGTAAVEAALLMPWVVFLFMGVLDFGFYNYAAIATENAARVGGLYYASSKGAELGGSAWVCTYVLAEMRSLPNVPPTLTTCATSLSGVTATQPVGVVLTPAFNGPDGRAAVQIQVYYRTMSLLPMPDASGNWITGGALTLTSTVQMRQDNES